MIRHIVLFKFKEGIGEEEVSDLAESFGQLPATIEEIREFTFGRDVVRSERSFDFALVSSFDDLESMQRYQVHPEHQKVIEKVKRLCDQVTAVDFEY